MDYSVLNFGQLLLLLGNEGLKNNFRNIEKKANRSLKKWHTFQCIQEGLQPNFTNIYIKLTQHMVSNIEGTERHKIKARNHPGRGPQCVIKYLAC